MVIGVGWLAFAYSHPVCARSRILMHGQDEMEIQENQEHMNHPKWKVLMGYSRIASGIWPQQDACTAEIVLSRTRRVTIPSCKARGPSIWHGKRKHTRLWYKSTALVDLAWNKQDDCKGQCSSCKEWFHKQWENINQSILDNLHYVKVAAKLSNLLYYIGDDPEDTLTPTNYSQGNDQKKNSLKLKTFFQK